MVFTFFLFFLGAMLHQSLHLSQRLMWVLIPHQGSINMDRDNYHQLHMALEFTKPLCIQVCIHNLYVYPASPFLIFFLWVMIPELPTLTFRVLRQWNQARRLLGLFLGREWSGVEGAQQGLWEKRTKSQPAVAPLGHQQSPACHKKCL